MTPAMPRSLRERLQGTPRTPASSSMATESAAEGVATMSTARRAESELLSPVAALQRSLHRKLVERLDFAALDALTDAVQITAQIRAAVAELLRTETVPLSQTEREQLIEHVVHEVTGLGPIEPLFQDGTVTDILVNGPRDVYVERHGRLHPIDIRFRDDAHLLAVIDRIVSRVGRRVDEASPMVDARLPDGSRVNAIIPPLAVDGPVLSIRRFGATLTADRLVELGALSAEMLTLLAGCVRARLNILVSGGTGSGKTTLLNALSSFIPDDERIVTIEDAAELRLQQAHVVRLETRPPNAEGRGEIVMRELVKNALRMRPDRIVIGEVRSAEALDMLQAMNTGHEGSLTTIHANAPRDALARLETMILFAGTNLPERAMREQIASALDVVIQVSRLADGSRRILSVTEITGSEGDMIQMQEIHRFRRRGIDASGHVVGQFEATGVRPRFADRLALAGVELPSALFAADQGGW